MPGPRPRPESPRSEGRVAGPTSPRPVTDAEGKALLPFLLAHASSPNYTIGFGWQPGDFVIWDNQATWHFAVDDYQGPRAYRKVIGG